MSTVIDRLKQRKIVQWALAYVAGAWASLQVLDFLRETFALPLPFVRGVTVLLVVGFLAVLVVAWYHGEEGRQRVSGPEMIMLSALFVVAGLGFKFFADDKIGARQTIAVLPFDNFSAEADNAYLANGLTEEITSQLAKVDDLEVMSRIAVTRALASDLSLLEVSQTLGVGAVLEGSVQVIGDQLRITAQLIDAATNKHLWSEDFHRSVSDLFAVQTEVALAIARALKAELTPQDEEELRATGTDNEAAYSAYLRSKELSANQPASNRSGIVLLQQAVSLDSEFVNAWSSLAWRYVWEARMGSPTGADSAMVLARHALDLNPRSAEAHFALASVFVSYGHLDDMVSSFEESLLIDPDYVSSLMDFSATGAVLGRLSTSLSLALRAVKLVPNSGLVRHHLWTPLQLLNDHERSAAWLDRAEAVGLGHSRLEIDRIALDLQMGRLDEAAEGARVLMEDYPGGNEPEWFAAQVLLWTGRLEPARGLLERFVRLVPDRSDQWGPTHRSARANLAFVLHELGETDQAAPMFQLAMEASQAAIDAGNEWWVHPLQIAAIHAFRGEHDQALDWLERSITAGFVKSEMLLQDPMFASLREDARFGSLVDRMNRHIAAEFERAVAEGTIAAVDAISAGGDPRQPLQSVGR